MNNIRLLFVFQIFWLCACGQNVKTDILPNSITNTNTEEHVRIEGTRILAKLPVEYEHVKELARYQKHDKLYIQVIETDATSYNDAKAQLSLNAITSKGAKVIAYQEIELNGRIAIFSEGPSKFAGENKLGLFFGDDNSMVMIAGVHKNNDQNGRDELLTIFKSIIWENENKIDPLELANFTFDETILNYKYAMKASNLITYTKDGKWDKEKVDYNMFSIGSVPNMSKGKGEAFIKDYQNRFEQIGMKFENHDIVIEEEGDISIHWESNSNFEDKNGFFLLKTFYNGESGIIVLASIFDDVEETKKKLEYVLRTVDFK